MKRINRQWVEGKVFNESDFSPEDFFNISLAENTKRRNLNPIEIGNFLESASESLGLNNAELAEQFGRTLGIGKPGQKVALSTIHKYREVNQIRLRGESPEIISDVINEKLQFSVASETLAPIKKSEDRDCLYLQIIKPFGPTRPQLTKILALLSQISPHLQEAVFSNTVQQAIAKAAQSIQPATALLKQLTAKKDPMQPTHQADFASRVADIRRTYFGEQASKRDFNITSPSPNSQDELVVNFRLKKEERHSTLQKLFDAIEHSNLFSDQPNKNIKP